MNDNAPAGEAITFRRDAVDHERLNETDHDFLFRRESRFPFRSRQSGIEDQFPILTRRQWFRRGNEEEVLPQGVRLLVAAVEFFLRLLRHRFLAPY